MKATFIKEFNGGPAWQILYRVEPAVQYSNYDGAHNEIMHATDYVIVSALPGETYIFPSDKDGKVLDYGELSGSFRGSPDHEKALRAHGVTEFKGGKLEEFQEFADNMLEEFFPELDEGDWVSYHEDTSIN